mgnify:CR=1 FL=1
MSLGRAFAAVLAGWAAALAVQAADPPAAAPASAAPRVLRYSFPIAETGFDPAQIKPLVAMAERTMQLQCMIQDSDVSFSDAERETTITPEIWLEPKARG